MRVSLLCHGRLPAQNLELRLQDRGFSFPVGRVGFQTLRPLSFFEFLDATGNRGLRQRLLTAFHEQQAPPPALHDLALAALGDYLWIGGMPGAVASWVDEQTPGGVVEVQASLLQESARRVAAKPGRSERFLNPGDGHMSPTIVIAALSDATRALPDRVRATTHMTTTIILSGLLMALTTSAATAAAKDVYLQVVDAVELHRYLGTWYEIASYPAWFQRGCTAVTATYSMRDDGLIKVVNSCRKGSLTGRLKESVGRAKVVDTISNAKLKVSFFGPFWGKYWIIDLDPNYQWAVVGEPKRKYLWILSRSRSMDDDLYAEIVARLSRQGYDPARLRRTLQPES